MGRSTKEKEVKSKKKSQRSPIKSHSLKNSSKSFVSSLRKKRKVSHGGSPKCFQDENYNRSYNGLKKTHTSFENFHPRPFPKSPTGSPFEPTKSPTTSSLIPLRDMDSSLFADEATMILKSKASPQALTSPIFCPAFFSPPASPSIHFGLTTEINSPDTSTLCLDQSTGGDPEEEKEKEGKKTSPFKRMKRSSATGGRPIRPASSIFCTKDFPIKPSRVKSFNEGCSEGDSFEFGGEKEEATQRPEGAMTPTVQEMRMPFTPEPTVITMSDPFKTGTPAKRRRLNPTSGNRRNSVVEEKIDYFERLSGIHDSPLVTNEALDRFLRRGSVPSGLVHERSTNESEDSDAEIEKKIEQTEQRCDHLKLEIARLEGTLRDQKAKESALQTEVASQTSLVKKQAARLEFLQESSQDTPGGDAEKLRCLENNVASTHKTHQQLREDHARLHTLWTEKCIEDCDNAMKMFEKEEKWVEEAQEKDDRVEELMSQLADRESLKEQVKGMKEVMREAIEKRECAERDLRDCQQKDKELEKNMADLETKLAETQEELDSIKQSLPTDLLTNDDFEEIQTKTKQQKDARMGVEEELGLLHDQVDELEERLSSSRDAYKLQIQALDGELTAYQCSTEDEIACRVEKAVREKLSELKKEFHRAHGEIENKRARPSKEDIEQQKKRLEGYLEEKIRRELQVKIREEVQEELEAELIYNFQAIEREGMSEIDSILDDDELTGDDGFGEGGGDPGFVDRLQASLMQQCREVILQEAEEIWAEEKSKFECELEELKVKAEAAEAKERELVKKVHDYTRKVQVKIQEINQMKYGSSANLLSGAGAPPPSRHQSAVAATTGQHPPVHTRTTTAPTEYGQRKPKESEKDVEERARKAAQAAQLRVREERKRKREKEKREMERAESEEAFAGKIPTSPPRQTTPAHARVKSRLSMRGQGSPGTPTTRRSTTTRDQTGTPTKTPQRGHASPVRSLRNHALSPLRSRGKEERRR